MGSPEIQIVAVSARGYLAIVIRLPWANRTPNPAVA